MRMPSTGLPNESPAEFDSDGPNYAIHSAMTGRRFILAASSMTMLFGAALTLQSCREARSDTVRDSKPTNASRTSLAREGRSFTDFVSAMGERREGWRHRFDSTDVSALRRRAAAAVPADANWHLIAVAEEKCSDSENTMPVLARLVDGLPGVDLRFVDSKVGHALMEAHHTPDGRAATPTVVLTNATGTELGCWIERPAQLAAWAQANKGRMSDLAFLQRRIDWYMKDAGQSTALEIVEMLEEAREGRVRCGSGPVTR